MNTVQSNSLLFNSYQRPLSRSVLEVGADGNRRLSLPASQHAATEALNYTRYQTLQRRFTVPTVTLLLDYLRVSLHVCANVRLRVHTYLLLYVCTYDCTSQVYRNSPIRLDCGGASIEACHVTPSTSKPPQTEMRMCSLQLRPSASGSSHGSYSVDPHRR